MKDRIQLRTKGWGEVIFEEGSDADDFFLIRSGFVKVSQKKAGGETVLRVGGLPVLRFGLLVLGADVRRHTGSLPDAGAS